jgi:hypothetical protein
MKTLLCSFLFVAAALLLPGCANVLVKKHAGDKLAELDPQIWEGRWIGADGVACTTKILKDKNLVEVRSTQPGEEDEVILLQVREFKDRLVGTALPKPGEKQEEEGLPFFRIAATENHLAVFMPVEDIFKQAVKAGTLPGRVHEAKKQAAASSDAVNLDYDRTSLDQFGAAELEKLPLKVKGSVLECFDPDPAMVFVREKKPETPGEGEKPGGTEK